MSSAQTGFVSTLAGNLRDRVKTMSDPGPLIDVLNDLIKVAEILCSQEAHNPELQSKLIGRFNQASSMTDAIIAPRNLMGRFEDRDLVTNVLRKTHAMAVGATGYQSAALLMPSELIYT